MKLLMTFIIIILIAFTFCGCSLKEESTVMQTDVVQITEDDSSLEEPVSTLNQTAEATKSLSIRVKYGIPESYVFSMQGTDKNLSIEVDAEVIVPNKSEISVFGASNTGFSQETAYALFNVLCKDTQMYIFTNILTKDMVRDRIELFKSRMSKYKEGSVEWNEAAAALAHFESTLDDAPDVLEEPLADGTIGEVDRSYAEGFIAYERYSQGVNGWGKFLTVINDNNSPYMYYADFKNSAAKFYWENQKVNEKKLDEKAETKIGISLDAAIEIAEQFIAETGLSYKIGDIYFQSDEEEKNCTYLIYCNRSVDGMIVDHLVRSNEEQFAIRINADGIVEVYWNYPIEGVEVVDQDVELKSWPEIEEVFEEAIIQKNAAMSEEEELVIRIDTIDLVLRPSKNAYGVTLIPVWNFYGNITVQSGTSENNFSGALMSINAINGIIVDIHLLQKS